MFKSVKIAAGEALSMYKAVANFGMYGDSEGDTVKWAEELNDKTRQVSELSWVKWDDTDPRWAFYRRQLNPPPFMIGGGGWCIVLVDAFNEWGEIAP